MRRAQRFSLYPHMRESERERGRERARESKGYERPSAYASVRSDGSRRSVGVHVLAFMRD